MSKSSVGLIILLLLAIGSCGPTASQGGEPTACSVEHAYGVNQARPLRLRGIYGWSHHGALLIRFECPETYMYVDTRAVSGTPLEQELHRRAVEMQSEPPSRAIEIDATGTVRWELMDLSGTSSERRETAVFYVNSLHGVSVVENDLRNACLLRNRSVTFCNCLQSELGATASLARMRAINAMLLREAQGGQLDPATDLRALGDVERQKFMQCRADRG